MKYALIILMAMPLFAGEAERMEAELAQGNMVPVIENGEVKSWTNDPTTNELANKKISKVEEDKSDEE